MKIRAILWSKQSTSLAFDDEKLELVPVVMFIVDISVFLRNVTQLPDENHSTDQENEAEYLGIVSRFVGIVVSMAPPGGQEPGSN